MNNYLKNRLICTTLFVVINFIYGGLVAAGYVGPTAALLYGLAGLLWALKLRQARNTYRRHTERGSLHGHR